MMHRASGPLSDRQLLSHIAVAVFVSIDDPYAMSRRLDWMLAASSEPILYRSRIWCPTRNGWTRIVSSLMHPILACLRSTSFGFPGGGADVVGLFTRRIHRQDMLTVIVLDTWYGEQKEISQRPFA